MDRLWSGKRTWRGVRLIVDADRTALSTIDLSQLRLRRESPRPVAHREAGYDAKFDANTLFYDVFASANGTEIIALTPPLFNCAEAIHAAHFRDAHDDTILPHRYVSSRTGEILRIDVTKRPMPTTIHMHVAEQVVPVTVSPSRCEAFAGRRVLYTLSKNNRLEWIEDWVRFHARVHGVDAVLIYDNQSDAYDTASLRRTLSTISEIATSMVVDWPFPYGPGSGPNGEWDSNYCQDRALAHMRFRFCAGASAVLNADVDELLVSTSGQSIFDALRNSGAPCLTFGGRWVTALRPRLRRSLRAVGQSQDIVRHSDCLYIEPEPAYLNKWIVDPARCPDDALWGTHAIAGLSGPAGAAADLSTPTTRDFVFRHFRQISNNWHYNRSDLRVFSERTPYDRELARALAVAFPDRQIFRHSGGPMRRAIDWLRQF